MFGNTIDNKKSIIDPNGNEIIDLATSIFSKVASGIEGYQTIKVDEAHTMRADKVSFDIYGSDSYTEMILKYSGISNPFTLNENDILMIPEYSTIYAQLAKEVQEDDSETEKQKIRNYYKFNSKYDPDQSSYKQLENLKIDSGVKTPKDTEPDYMVPYISDDGTTAITIRNGRMYFGEDAGPSAATTNMDEKIQNLINSTATAIADQCAMNGLSLTDFVRASTKNS